MTNYEGLTMIGTDNDHKIKFKYSILHKTNEQILLPSSLPLWLLVMT